MTLDGLLRKAQAGELTGADVTGLLMQLEPVDMALLIQVVGGLVYRDDLEPDYIANRVREWRELKTQA